MKFDHQMFISLYESSQASQFGALDDNQASGIDALLGFLEQDAGVSDVRWAAYMLATVKEECANTWQPIEEIGKGQGYPYGNPVTVTDGNGNTYVNTYYGRGYPQLTGEGNYQQMGQNLNLGDQLLYHPERALDPSTSYDILSFGMINGSFTGVGLGDFIDDSQTDYFNARRIVNGLDNAQAIADYATTLESLLRQSSSGEGPGPRQYHIVNAPRSECAKGTRLKLPRCAWRRQQQPDRHRLPGARTSRQWQQHLEQAGGRNIRHRLLLRHPQLQQVQSADPSVPASR